MEHQPEQGIIRSIIDCGTLVQVVIETDDGTRVLAAEGNMFRRAIAALGKASLAGVRIEYAETDWPGGLLWFSVIDEGHVVCPCCRKHIPPHLDPDMCMFGLHRRKNLGNKNGAHSDE